MKILMVNCICGVGSTGRIVADLYHEAKKAGHIVKIACSTVEPIKGVDLDDVFIIGSKADYYTHNILSRLTDREGLFSKAATKKFLKQVKSFDPDVVHLHNLHGHWINYELLFQYLISENKKTIWTLHDCWAFTGHCAHFDSIGCTRWKQKCDKCKYKQMYPQSYLLSSASHNYNLKKYLINRTKDLTIVCPSKWLADLAKQSFLNEHEIRVINNGIDLHKFYPNTGLFRINYGLEDKTIILGVANNWNREKGFYDFCKLSEILTEKERIILVGLTEEQKKTLPHNMIGITRTTSIFELNSIYSDADVFLNLTYVDTFPTVNMEALACGTPVITYKTGGSAEMIDDICGRVVEQGNLCGVLSAIDDCKEMNHCAIAEYAKRFNNQRATTEYMKLYAY